jgi:hypothetical protein
MQLGADAINMDTAEEATRLLETTGLFTHSDVPMSPASALVSPGTAYHGGVFGQPRSQPRSQPQAIAEGREHSKKSDQPDVSDEATSGSKLQFRDPTFMDLTKDLGVEDSDSEKGCLLSPAGLPPVDMPFKPRKDGIFSLYRTPRSPVDAKDLQPNSGAAEPFVSLSPRNVSAQLSPPAPRNKHAYANQLDLDDQTVSIELQRSSHLQRAGGHAPNSEAHSYALADHPTGSHPLAPGPYHKANCRLRKLLPLYSSTVTVTTSWLHITMTILTVLAFLWYIGLRAYYLLSGKVYKFELQNVSVPYSWVVLAAEIALTSLGFYGHQAYWRQNVHFKEMSDEEYGDMVEVWAFTWLSCETLASGSAPDI